MRRLFFYAILGLAFLLAACRTDQPVNIPPTGETNPPPPVPTPTLAPEVPPTLQVAEPTVTPLPTQQALIQTSPPPVAKALGSNPVEEIVAALRGLANQQSFRVEQTINAPEATTVYQIDIIPPDRFRMQNPDMELVIIGEAAYTKVDGQWMSAPGSGETIIGSYVFLNSDQAADEFRRLVIGAVFIGEEDLNGERVRVYEYPLVDEEEGTTANIRLWVSVADGLPRRQEIRIPGEAGEAVITNVYHGFNEPMSIEPPQ